MLAVATSAYLAAVFMAADAQRLQRGERARRKRARRARRSGRERALVDELRTRALIAGAVAGAVALVGLFVLHEDAHFLYARLLRGGALAACRSSPRSAGLRRSRSSLRERFEPARYSAALRRRRRLSPAGRSRSARCCSKG